MVSYVDGNRIAVEITAITTVNETTYNTGFCFRELFTITTAIANAIEPVAINKNNTVIPSIAISC